MTRDKSPLSDSADSAGAAFRAGHASALETAKVFTFVLGPIFARGILARRPRIVGLAERADADRRAVKLLARLRDRHGAGLLLLRMPVRRQALVLTPPAARRVLTGSPEPYALATREKRAALLHFQPHGVLVSHGADRLERRAFNEAVLDTANPVHRLAGPIAATIEQEAAELLRDAGRTGELDWDRFRVAWWRVIRRVVLGDVARDDHEISDLLTRLRMNANWAFAHPRRRIVHRRFRRRLTAHLDRAEPGSLAELVGAVPATDRTDPAGQVPQWLFAFEPAGMVAFRTLALLASHPEHARRAHAEAAASADPAMLPFLRACVHDSVRLWPTTFAVLRQSTRDTEWAGRRLPAGTGLIVLPAFLQRDAGTLPSADVFSPDQWLDGTADRSWSLVPFSAGPGECPGRNLVLLTTTLFLAELLKGHEFRQTGGTVLRPDRPLPGTFGPFRLRLAVRRRPAEQTGPAGTAGRTESTRESTAPS